MAFLNLQIAVSSPCPGEQLVSKVTPYFYYGSAGDFSGATVSRNSAATRWTLILYDLDRETPCSRGNGYPFVQVNANANDPTGAYYGRDANGNPDANLGTATVTSL